MNDTLKRKETRQLIAPSGDWFQIQIDHLSDRRSCIMSRIVAWAVVTYESASPGSTEFVVEGIDSNGYGHVDEHLDYFNVCGDDLAPNGASWRDIFNDTPSFNWGLKDISELADTLFARKW